MIAKKPIFLWFFILLKFALQYYLINPVYDLQRDEYLHLDQAKHLSWGYISVPPVTSWISWIIAQLGNTVFWIKFFPALFGALTIVVVWKIINELKGNLYAHILAAVALTFSALLRINILYQPNSLEILFWTLFYLTLIKFINTKNNKWLWIAALTVAFGFLNKYNIIFLLLALLPAVLLTEHRRIFTNKYFYLSVLFFVLLVSPNLVWQYQNHFPVYHHLKELAATQLVNVNRLDFLKEQLLFFMSSLFVLIAAFISFLIYPPFNKYRVIGLSYLFAISMYVYLRAKGYYAIGLYPTLFAFGAIYLEQLFSTGWKRYLRPVTILVVLLLFIPFIKIILPILTPEEIVQKEAVFKKYGLLRWEDGKDHPLPQDFADMLGWKELANKVDAIYDTIPDKGNTLVYCDNYGEAGAINYYSKNHSINARSLNADYINWFGLDKMEIKNVIMVKSPKDEDKDRTKERPIFEKVLLAGKIENRFAREYGAAIFVLEGAKISINERFKKEIEIKQHE